MIGEDFDVPLVTASWGPLGDTAVEDPSPELVFEALESARADYLERAADTARARLSYTDAARLFERAASHAATASRRDALLLACGQAHLQATNVERARQLAEQVTVTGTPEQVLKAAVVFESASWQTNTHQPRSVELLTAALARTEGAGPDRDRIVATAALARAVSFTERPGRAAALRADAIRRARDIGEPALLAVVLSISLLDGGGEDGLTDRLRLADELTGLVDDLGDVQYLGPAAFHRCLCHYVLGDPAAVDVAYLDLVRMTRATNEPYWTLAVSVMSFGLHVMRCEFAEAALALEQTARLSTTADGGYEAAEGPWSLQSFILRRETGDLEAARHLINGDEDPAHSWAPGLLALPEQRQLPPTVRADALDGSLPYARLSIRRDRMRVRRCHSPARSRTSPTSPASFRVPSR